MNTKTENQTQTQAELEWEEALNDFTLLTEEEYEAQNRIGRLDAAEKHSQIKNRVLRFIECNPHFDVWYLIDRFSLKYNHLDTGLFVYSGYSYDPILSLTTYRKGV